jgi:hypothetical protein
MTVYMSEPTLKSHWFEVAAVKDYNFGARECDLHFGGKGVVWDTARRIIAALRERKLDTVLVGDLAMFLHGYRRVTSVVELLVDEAALAVIRDQLDLLGVSKDFPTANSIRDIQTHVKIRLHIAGRPRTRQGPAVLLPHPRECGQETAGFPVIQLVPLIDMRLAIGLEPDTHERETIDVIELIRVLHLPLELMDELNPIVRDKYLQYWTCLNVPPPKYIRPLRAPGCLESMDNPDELLAKCGLSAELRGGMLRDGILLERRPSGRAMLTTTDWKLAEKYDMHLEDEYWRIDEY